MIVVAKNLLAEDTLAARWSQDIVAEKSCILVAAFIYLFDLLGTASTRDLLEITVIFYGFEIVTDVLLVYVLDKYFDLPFLRLPRKNLKDLVKETVVLSQTVISCAFGLKIAHSIVNGDS